MPHTCVCGVSVDSTGRHGLSCQKSADSLSRHSAVNDLIKRALLLVEDPSKLEPISLLPQNERRPDGKSLTPWKNGRFLACDVTCPDTLAPSHLNTAINGSDIVVCEAADKKRNRYANLAPSFCFVPVAVETLGALGAGAVGLLYERGRRIAESTGERLQSTTKVKCCRTAWQRSQCAGYSRPRVSRLVDD